VVALLILSSPCSSASKRLVASQSNLHFSLQNNDIANAGISFYDAGMCGRFTKTTRGSVGRISQTKTMKVSTVLSTMLQQLSAAVR